MRAIRTILIMITIAIILTSGTAVYATKVSYTELTEAKWDAIRPYSEGMAAVMVKVKIKGYNGEEMETEAWGYINDRGKVVVEPKFGRAGDFHEGVAWVVIEDGVGLDADINVQIIDKSGNVVLEGNKLAPERYYYSATDCSQGIIGFMIQTTGHIDYYDLTGKYIVGSRDITGEEQEYITTGYRFSDNVACIKINNQGKEKIGYIDTSGKITYLKDEIKQIGYYSRGLAMAKTDQKWGIIDKKGIWAISPQYDSLLIDDTYNAQVFSNYGTATLKKDGKWGVIDKQGNIVIPFENTLLSYNYSGFIVYQTQEKGKFGIYNSKGEKIIEPIYDEIYPKSSFGIIPVKKNNKYGYIKQTGEEIIPPKYEEISTIIDKKALVKENNKYKWIDIKGNTIEVLDKNIGSIGFDQQNGTIEYIKNQKHGLIKMYIETPKVTVNGKELQFDQDPIMYNSKVLVPMRAIFEELEAQVEWEEKTQTITATKQNTTIKMQVGNKTMTVNGQEMPLIVEPQIISGRTLIPVRAIAESLNAKVGWDNDTKTVIIER